MASDTKRPLKVLCIHGLGGQSMKNWEQDWTEAIRAALPDGATAKPAFATYDPIFAKTDIGLFDTVKALGKLGWSGLSQLFQRDRAFGGVTDPIRLTAGYVVAWVEDKEFKKKTRAFLLEQLRETQPDVILAHSLGSLLAYDAFAHRDAAETTAAAALAGAHFVTLGSQLGNPFVKGNLTGGRIVPLPVRRWTHLFNPGDDIFTAPLTLQNVANFTQVLTPFDDPKTFYDHAATLYIPYKTTREAVWLPEAALAAGPKPKALSKTLLRAAAEVVAEPAPARVPQRRALLVGINAYPAEADRLEGCVNDVFTMSAVLQDCGFRPEEIRLCLDDRATAAGIRERLGWLLADAGPGDELVFYYSGHGAQVPQYGPDQEPDHLSEVLVPWDFDWTPERAISDETICALYSQLPYDTRFVMVLDCCHAGGIHRQGGARARGLTPPDDIRHRGLKWDRRTQMWVPRDFARLTPGFSSKPTVTRKFFGDKGATVRLGRAAQLRTETERVYVARTAKATGPVGPYLPMILEACAEGQTALEYRDGVTSHGAFTFVLARILRETAGQTFDEVVDRTGARLAELGYVQIPQILGPELYRTAPVPFQPLPPED